MQRAGTLRPSLPPLPLQLLLLNTPLLYFRKKKLSKPNNGDHTHTPLQWMSDSTLWETNGDEES